jgi:hypothetical protein
MKNQPIKAGFLHSDGFVLNVYAVTRHCQALPPASAARRLLRLIRLALLKSPRGRAGSRGDR